jgi:hypothetical protein
MAENEAINIARHIAMPELRCGESQASLRDADHLAAATSR